MSKASLTKPRRLAALAGVLAACALGGTPVHAQDAQNAPDGGAPAVVTAGGVTYVTGGVGEDESSAIRAMASRFNLRLLFATKDGTYLSDVEVLITTEPGAKILKIRSDGPMVDVRLAPGRYRIDATADGNLQERHVSVPAHGGVDVNFYWG